MYRRRRCCHNFAKHVRAQTDLAQNCPKEGPADPIKHLLGIQREKASGYGVFSGLLHNVGEAAMVVGPLPFLDEAQVVRLNQTSHMSCKPICEYFNYHFGIRIQRGVGEDGKSSV